MLLQISPPRMKERGSCFNKGKLNIDFAHRCKTAKRVSYNARLSCRDIGGVKGRVFNKLYLYYLK